MATQTTTVQPPAFQLPYLQYGLGQAKQLYGQGAGVVPFSQQSEQAIQGVTNRATGGSPLVGAAQGFVQQGLQNPITSMFGSATNPQLDATFERARLASQGGLASEFARSGRNVSAAQGLRGQQLGDLATQIYGGAYESERNRMFQDMQGQRSLQQGLLGSVLPLANQDYVDLAQLRGAGSDIEGMAREYQEAPQTSLDRYLGRVSGNFGSTTTTPLYRNSGTAALGGALLGSQVGSSVSSNPYAGLWGALAGGALGYLGG
jgi:hypothetical protein